MSEPLTERQSEILKLIKELTEVSGFPPTRAEIASRMGFRSVNAAEQHLRALERKGALDITSGSSRGIKIRERAGHRVSRLLELPVIVSPAEYSAWLSGEEGLLQPCPDSAIDIRRVSRAVNNARNEAPGLIEPEEG